MFKLILTESVEQPRSEGDAVGIISDSLSEIMPLLESSVIVGAVASPAGGMRWVSGRSSV